MVTGIAREMWPCREKTVKKYKVNSECITSEAIEVDTLELDTVFVAVMIATKFLDRKHQPDFDDSGQIVNVAIFDKLYKSFV